MNKINSCTEIATLSAHYCFCCYTIYADSQTIRFTIKNWDEMWGTDLLNFRWEKSMPLVALMLNKWFCWLGRNCKLRLLLHSCSRVDVSNHQKILGGLLHSGLHLLDDPTRLLLWDRSSKASSSLSTCHVASPSCNGRLNTSAFRFTGSHKFFCIALKFVATTWSNTVSRLATSFSATCNEMSGHRRTEGNGRRILSAIMTGMQPSRTDSTSRGLHGAQPSGQRQNRERAISDR